MTDRDYEDRLRQFAEKLKSSYDFWRLEYRGRSDIRDQVLNRVRGAVMADLSIVEEAKGISDTYRRVLRSFYRAFPEVKPVKKKR